MRCPLVLVFVAMCAAAQAQTTPALQQLNSYLNVIGIAQAAGRSQKVAAIHTRAEADQRQAEVRSKILKLIGGLPERTRPIRAKQFGTVAGDDFHIEKIAYESLPEFYVTANVFVPAGAGPFPAIVITPGHGAGKQSEYNWGANFAHAGIVALVVDPLGQGERMQHWDPEIGSSKIERLGEHEHASLSTLLIGDHVSRYFINDGIAGVDYLSERKDVDATHIGAFGCSGGGTITAYLAALDPRVSVAASAAIVAEPGAPPPVTVAKEEQRDGYRVQTLSIQSEAGIDLNMIQAIPDGSSQKPVIMIMDEVPADRTAAAADFARLAKSGHIVVVLQSRGTPIDSQNGQSAQFALGPYMGVNLRAIIVGKTLVGMRTDDVIHVLNWLSSRADVDRTSITLYGKTGLGMVALHAAAVDTRITRVIAENSLVSYRTALDAPLHRNLSEITIPGVLRHYDVSDLLEAIAPREVTLLNPVDAIGQPIRFEQVRRLGYPERVRHLRRGAREPLPIE
jgi:cephalosporin-C deacetylase-like acetyl esterase